MKIVDTQHKVTANSTQRRTVIVTAHQGDNDMPITWPVAYRLVSQVPWSRSIPSAPRMSGKAAADTPSPLDPVAFQAKIKALTGDKDVIIKRAPDSGRFKLPGL